MLTRVLVMLTRVLVMLTRVLVMLTRALVMLTRVGREARKAPGGAKKVAAAAAAVLAAAAAAAAAVADSEEAREPLEAVSGDSLLIMPVEEFRPGEEGKPEAGGADLAAAVAEEGATEEAAMAMAVDMATRSRATAVGTMERAGTGTQAAEAGRRRMERDRRRQKQLRRLGWTAIQRESLRRWEVIPDDELSSNFLFSL
jgi:hypothetical protein